MVGAMSPRQTAQSQNRNPDFANVPEPSVAGIVTLGKAPKSVIYAVSVAMQGRSYRLEVGTKDPDDPGQIEPHDYHPDTNPHYWQRIS